MFNSTTITVCKAWVSMFDSIKNGGLTVDAPLFQAALPHFVELVDVAERFQDLTNSRDEYVAALQRVLQDKDKTIDNLRKDLDGMSRVNKTMGDVIWKDIHV